MKGYITYIQNGVEYIVCNTIQKYKDMKQLIKIKIKSMG